MALFDNGKAAEEAANRARKQAFRKRRLDAKQRRQQQRFQKARVPHTKAEAGESTESSDTDSMGTPKYGYLTEPFDDPPAGCHEPADLYSPIECFYRQRQLRAEERVGVGSVAPGFGDDDSKLHLLDIPSAKYDINLLPLLYKLVRESASALQIRLGVREVVKSIRMQQEKHKAGGHIQETTAKVQSACAVCALVIFAEDVKDEPSFVSLDVLAALCHANKIQTLMVPISNIRTHIVTTRARAHTYTHTHTYHTHTNSPTYTHNTPPSHTQHIINIPDIIQVQSGKELSAACGHQRPVLCAAVFAGKASHLTGQLRGVQRQIRALSRQQRPRSGIVSANGLRSDCHDKSLGT